MPHRINRVAIRSIIVLISGCTIAASPMSATDYGLQSIKSSRAAGYLQRADLMLENCNYLGAVDQMRRMASQISPEGEGAEAAFILAKALFGLGSKDAERAIDEFLSYEPASLSSPEARLLKADILFFSGNYLEALNIYRQTDISREQSPEGFKYFYREAVCELKTADYSKARKMFSEMRQTPGYSDAARYYLSYISYVEGDLATALDGFKRLQKTHPEIPTGCHDLYPISFDTECYIAQIEFAMGNYREAFDSSRKILDSGVPEDFIPELQRVAGESAFKLGMQEDALKYLRKYFANSGISYASTAIYDMGVLQYNAGDYQSAINTFSELTELNDPIAQSAFLYLGQCAMKEGDLSTAVIDFEKAYKMDMDRTVTEPALYNYVSARMSGGKIPFQSSVELMEYYLKRFGDTSTVNGRSSELRLALAKTYFNERYYAKALENARLLGGKEAALLAQQSLYELGVEASYNSRWKESISYLSECASISTDPALASQSEIWLGQAYYNNGQFPEAVSTLNRFLKWKGADKKQKALATYDLGYALYMQDKFSSALPLFKDAMQNTYLPETLRDDALVRLADCTYYSGDYSAAAKMYATAAESSGDKAYALMRNAVMLGLHGDNDAQISGLENMIRKYPESKWIPDALGDLASALTKKGDIKAAENTYGRIISEHTASTQAKRAVILLGDLYVRSGDKAKAIDTYMDAIRRWPSSDEAVTANDDLRRLCAETGQLDRYLSFIESVPGAPKAQRTLIEKAAFDAAESPWLENSSDTDALEKFVESFPNSIYIPAALLDLAISADEKEDYATALGRLDALLSKGLDTEQAPEALSMKARILEEQFPDRSQEAEQAYRLLEKNGGSPFLKEAYSGLMRLSKAAKEKLEYAEKLLSDRGLSIEQRDEAIYEKSIALASLGRTEEAEKLLSGLASNPSSLSGAKANVALGELYISSGQPAKAVKLLNEFTEQGSEHQYWLARGYITLSDALRLTGRKAAANEYIRSLRENYPGNETDITEMIKSRLEK